LFSKEDFELSINYFDKQLRVNSVDVHLRKIAIATEIASSQFDHVIVATGMGVILRGDTYLIVVVRCQATSIVNRRSKARLVLLFAQALCERVTQDTSLDLL
jgi:hypothetical protein